MVAVPVMVLPFTAPELAVMVLEPLARPVARPALVMATMEGFELVQVMELVTFCVLPSL